MFGFPPIVCHHDFSKSALPAGDFTENVSFVRPHIETAWAEFSVVEATVRAIERMYEAPESPEWFVVLSGADYPIKSPARILRDLNEGSFDAHIHFELITSSSSGREWQRDCHLRYCTKRFTLPYFTKRLQPRSRTLELRHPVLTKPLLPFSRNLSCFAGSQWFSANRRAARYIINFHKTRTKLAAHYRTLMFPEESYFQTVLANADALKLHDESWRYADWSENQSHPKVLLTADLPRLLASRAHFARKFDVDADQNVLDELDKVMA